MTAPTHNQAISVALTRVAGYEHQNLLTAINAFDQVLKFRPPPRARVLVKPNLLAPKPPDFLPCTHPAVVRAVCVYLLEGGAEIRVGDSPSLGKGVDIAAKIGLTRALADLPVRIVELDRPRRIRFPFGGYMGISSEALESDFIFNLPKLKAHHMFSITVAVKNLFGCVSGLDKAFSHARYGDWGNCFERLLLELGDILPPTINLLDGITAMHVSGPATGEPYPLELLAASPSAVALDTTLYAMLNIPLSKAPLWQEAQNQSRQGAKLEDIYFPLKQPQAFNVAQFQTPASLKSFTYLPFGRKRRILKRYIDRMLPLIFGYKH
jgi:uncharacterized protein (DUF362 family)